MASPLLLLLTTLCVHGRVLSFRSHSAFTTSSTSVGRRNANTNINEKLNQNHIRSIRRHSLNTPPLHLVSDDKSSSGEPKESNNKEELEKLSDLDARVLQSLLEDENLDLKSEQNLKKMLERGVKKKETPNTNSNSNAQSPDKESEFSSTFFKVVNDNELWNSFVAKADEIVESAKIYLQNRIERDAKLLASIGVFAWQRAIKDAGRALPSAGKSGAAMAKKMRDSLFLLSNNSSFVEYEFKDNFILPPSKYSKGVETSVFEELNTPMDEIKSVTASIRDILSGKKVSSDRGLRSVAKTRGDRQRMAYERKKKTVLKREKEGVDARVARTASSVTDTIWELKREMEVEGNEAGYRAKDVQQRLGGTFDSVKMLGESPNRVLRGIGERIFGAAKESTPQIAGGTSESVSEDALEPMLVLTKADLDEERARLAASLEVCLEMPGKTWLTPSTVSSSDKEKSKDIEGLKNETSTKDVSDAFNVKESITEDINVSDEELDRMVSAPITTMVLARNDLEAQINDESEVFNNQDDIIAELKEMKKTVDMIASLAASSAGYDASEALRNELLGASQEDGGSLLSSLDDIIGIIEAQARETEARREAQARQAEERRVAQVRQAEARREAQARESEVKRAAQAKEAEEKLKSKTESRNYVFEDAKIDVEVQTLADVQVEVVDVVNDSFVMEKEESFTSGENRVERVDVEIVADADFKVVSSVESTSQKEEPKFDGSSQFEYANVELITDDEVDVITREVKDLNSAAFDDSRAIEVDETSSSEEKRPLAVTLALRTIDILLFIIEKTLTVGLPGLFTAWGLFSKRTETLGRQGLGKEGWDELENFSDAKRRY